MFCVSLSAAPDDYFPLNLFLLFTPGIQYITVTLHAFEDLIVEPELEQFSLSLGVLVVPAGSVSFTRPNATVFIEDSNSKSRMSKRYFSMFHTRVLLRASFNK